MTDPASPRQRARSAREQARRLAETMRNEDRARAIKFAEELEQKADQLEQQAGASASPQTTQQQEQGQQEQATGATPDPSDPKAKP